MPFDERGYFYEADFVLQIYVFALNANSAQVREFSTTVVANQSSPIIPEALFLET